MQSEKERLIAAIVSAAQSMGLHAKFGSPALVAGALRLMRREAPPELSNQTDDVLLRLLLAHLTGDSDAAQSSEEAELAQLIREATALCYKERFQEAKAVLAKAEKLAVRTGNHVALGWVKQYLGRAERDAGHLDQALPIYEEALAIANSAGDPKLVAVLYDQMGTVFLRRSDFDQADIYFRMSLSADASAESYAKGNLALLAKLRGEMKESARLNKASRRAYQAAGDERGESMTDLLDAQERLAAGDHTAAGRAALRAHRLGVETGHGIAEKDAENMFFEIVQDLVSGSDSVDQFKGLLGLEWLPAEWGIHSMVLLNAFMRCADADLPIDAVEFAWALLTLANQHNDPSSAAAVQRRSFFRKSPLQRVHKRLTDLRRSGGGGSPEQLAEWTFALARCSAMLGDSANAKKLALEARHTWQSARKVDNLRRVDIFLGALP